MIADPAKVRPLGNWVLCRAVEPTSVTDSGLVMPKDFDKDVVTEGVATVVAVGPGLWSSEQGAYVPPLLTPDETVVYRGFLRFAHQFEDAQGRKHFMLDVKDILLSVKGPGTVGRYDEYRIG